MTLLVTADLHFTDSPRDAHRWDLLPWLGKQAQKQDAEAVLLLGDLTDAKNHHSAALVNRLVQGLSALAAQTQVIIIRGNHDYIDESEPFFGFVNSVSSATVNNIRFLTKPTLVQFNSVGKCLFLPNTRDYEKEWGAELAHHLPCGSVKYIFTHQTYDGCTTENGTTLNGIPPSVFEGFAGKVYSGDIHKPQKVGRNIEYVGAPYRCRFGDEYEPRVLLIQDDGTTKDLHFPTKNKVLIRLPPWQHLAEHLHRIERGEESGEEVFEGDQIKVRVQLPRAQYGEWPVMRAQIVKDAAALGLELTGPELVPRAPDAPQTPASAPGGPAGGQTGGEGAITAYAAAKGASAPLRAEGLALYKQAASK